MTDIVERLLTMENFYMDRPSVDQEVQTPTLTEVTERECDQIAILLHETRVEIERLRAASKWQKIDDNTPTGERILLWNKRTQVGKWEDYRAFNQPKFTHWMPLPSHTDH